MAEIVLVEATSHSPYLYSEPEWWAENRARRPVRADVPVDSPEVNRAKHDQCMQDFARLREQVDAAKPDVLLIFGDDQLEQFSFNNFPAFGIYMGEEVFGNHPNAIGRMVVHGERTENPEQVHAKGHPQLGKHLMESLMDKGFDIAFSLERPNKERGIGHAFVNPSFYINPSYEIPILPFWVNCYYAPQPTGMRCYHLGQAVRESIAAMPSALRIAIVASGGLWHTPGSQDAYLDEDFDRAMINAVKSGDAREMAEYFDSVPWEYPKERPERGPDRAAWTGMNGGVGSGAGETRNWLIAASVMEGKPAAFADYVPVYASPCGMGFAYWNCE